MMALGYNNYEVYTFTSLAARCFDIAGGFLVCFLQRKIILEQHSLTACQRVTGILEIRSVKKAAPFERAASEGKNGEEFYMNPHKEAYKQLL